MTHQYFDEMAGFALMITVFWLGMVGMCWVITSWHNAAIRLREREQNELVAAVKQVKPDMLDGLETFSKSMLERFLAMEKQLGTQSSATQAMVSQGIVKWEGHWKDLNARTCELEDKLRASSSAPSPPSPQSGSAS
jgi:hypothetical protein